MRRNVLHYHQMFDADGINTVYSGPLWAKGIEGLAEMLQTRLDYDELSPSMSQSIFSVFVEQMNNMLMYSADTEPCLAEAAARRITKGTFILGLKGKGYFLQTGNVVSNANAGGLRERIDYLNTLDGAGLRKYYREKLRGDNDNPESRGGGLGLIEIARRASSKIEYTLTPQGEGFSFFEMYITIGEIE